MRQAGSAENPLKFEVIFIPQSEIKRLRKKSQSVTDQDQTSSVQVVGRTIILEMPYQDCAPEPPASAQLYDIPRPTEV